MITCLSTVANAIATRATIKEVFADTLAAMVQGWQYPEVTRVRIRFDGVEHLSQPFVVTPWHLSSDIVVEGVVRGSVEVSYLEERPDVADGPFLEDERKLLAQIALMLGREVKARAAEHELDRIFSYALDLICVADLHKGIFTRVNPAVTRILGYSESEFVGAEFLSFNHPDDVQPTIDVVERELKAGAKVIHFENRYRHKNGGYRWLSWVSHPDMELGVTFAIARDVTQQKESVLELERLNEKLKQSNQDLEQFAYVASHDLQEPLRAVSSFARLLGERCTGSDDKDDKAGTYIQQIVDGSKRMQCLINDLLSYSRVSTRGAPAATVDSHVALQQALANLMCSLQEAHGIVTNDELPRVKVDPAQLVQLFQNLIGNALKFRAPDTRPEVHVSARRQDDTVVFSVKDNGIGIEAEHLERIFEVFSRLHGRASYEGTGIGLAVCRRVVERHGGRLWVESTPGEGSTFYFSLAVDAPK